MKMTEERLAQLVTDLGVEIGRVARAITADAVPGHDAAGSMVGSMTEAVMGVTGGLVRVADSISELAAAVRGLSDQ